MRIGEMLISAGLLTPEETERILRRQQSLLAMLRPLLCWAGYLSATIQDLAMQS